MGAYCIKARHSVKADKECVLCLALAGSGMAGVLLLTPRSAGIHNVARGVLACSFAALLLYMLYSLSKVSQEADRLIEIKGVSKVGTASELFAQSIYLFIAAVICWICDNGLCSVLRRLPVYIPLHAVWHVLSAVALYDWSVLLMFHRQLFQGKAATLHN